ncbi:RagB/SusD family nutrient uptake outer membrane protein [Pedobacter hartonius]|uniref:RagB/SusD domain-containing protein n=1 Tax=Pedobacter hartonius TaxID=425514 RepID=A0A1H4CU24_9SPHI|nr:RagB/SusD family nutrient uptake outer membrane protein [Pedobacter hartonius]SEA63847.1 RagB/SusD domain-containing protein [Pedobacter hartonius]
MKNIKKQLVLFILIIASGNYSCKKFLKIDAPINAATPAELFSNDAIATSAITGIYSKMASFGAFAGGQSSISVLCGLSSDELKSHSSTLDGFYKNEILPSEGKIGLYLWAETYNYIYITNATLAGLESSTGISEITKRQLEGEAKFVRAISYFYLVNLFGEVPLNLSTDYRINEKNGNSSKELIYAQIVKDLTEAETLLQSEYVTIERIRPNKWAAKALLSRVYLYLEKWDLAAQKSAEVIDQTAMYSLLDNLDNVFLKNSQEAIWQLMPTQGSNTQEGIFFNLIATPSFVSIPPDILPKFDASDLRKTKWINKYSDGSVDYYFPYKYKIRTTVNGQISEYSMVIRLAELFLIRAEARAQQGQTSLALEDLNKIRKRAGLLTPLIGLDQAQCLSEVAKQRRLELFSEWGHRWFDLKRTKQAASVLAPLKGPTWQETDALYPIPLDEINRNHNVKQNPGYN